MSKENSGRAPFWLGFVLPFLGAVAYAVLAFGLGRLTVPWYMPIIGTAGIVLMIFGLRRRRGILRYAAFVLGLLVVLMQWASIYMMALPDYEGPARVGVAFPAFEASRADGAPFDRTAFAGHRATVVVFYRGWW